MVKAVRTWTCEHQAGQVQDDEPTCPTCREALGLSRVRRRSSQWNWVIGLLQLSVILLAILAMLKVLS